MNKNGELLGAWKEAVVAYRRCITDGSEKVNNRHSK